MKIKTGEEEENLGEDDNWDLSWVYDFMMWNKISIPKCMGAFLVYSIFSLPK